MKKTVLIISLFISLIAIGQDTTNLRFIALETYSNGDFLYFKNDTTDLYEVASSINQGNGNGTGHALFVNPTDGYLYAIMDPNNFSYRALYKVNPLTGQADSIMQIGDHPASAEITNDGRLFSIEGNGGANPDAIYEIDIMNKTDSIVFTPNIPAISGEPRALVFNPNDTSLYLYSSYIDSVYIINVNSWNVTSSYAYMPGETHGGYYRDNQFWLVSYYGEINYVNLNDSLGGYTIKTSNQNLMDITEFSLIKENQNIGLCANESTVLHARYASNSYQWYRNDTLLNGETNDSLFITAGGVYKLLTQIDTSNNYIWSEEITVNILNVPNVTISASTTLWCPGDSILLTGSFGGQSQWYMNGNPISGANSNTYIATAPGVYNMIKTNQNGCSDSAAVGVTIVQDPNCPNGISNSDLNKSLLIYPVPFESEIYVSYNEGNMSQIILTNIEGKIIKNISLNGNAAIINTSELSKGVYFIEIMTDDDNKIIRKKLIK